MNTMGKILAFLNLLFALAVGGFLAVDFATRSNWKQAYDNLKTELDVARSNSQVYQSTVQLMASRLKKAEEHAKDLESQLLQARKEADQLLKEKINDLADSQRRAEGADVSAQAVTAENERLKKENKELLQVISAREKKINELVEARNKAEERMQEALHERDAALLRNDNLLQRNRELELKLAKAQVGKGGPAAALPPDPRRPNPPAVYVRGKVVRVSAEDPSLLEIDLGSDNGLAEGQTLDVYRLAPEPIYLGMVRLQDVRPHVSIARLLPRPANGAARYEVRPGDEVASSILGPR